MNDFDLFYCFETYFDKERKECLECSEHEGCKEERIHYDRILEIDRRKALEGPTK